LPFIKSKNKNQIQKQKQIPVRTSTNQRLINYPPPPPPPPPLRPTKALQGGLLANSALMKRPPKKRERGKANFKQTSIYDTVAQITKFINLKTILDFSHNTRIKKKKRFDVSTF